MNVYFKVFNSIFFLKLQSCPARQRCHCALCVLGILLDIFGELSSRMDPFEEYAGLWEYSPDLKISACHDIQETDCLIVVGMQNDFLPVDALNLHGK